MQRKNYYILIVLLLSSWSVKSQSLNPGAEILNPYLDNPAFISQTDSLRINLRTSSLNSIIDFGPSLKLGSDFLYSPTGKRSSFMAGYSYASRVSDEHLHSLRLGYAYKHSFNQDLLISMGVFLTGSHFRTRYDYIPESYNYADHSRGHKLSMTPALLVKYKNLKLSLRTKMYLFDVTKYSHLQPENDHTVDKSPYLFERSAMLSYKFYLTPRLPLEPYFKATGPMKTINPQQITRSWFYDVGAILHISDAVRLGTGYSTAVDTKLGLYPHVYNSLYAFGSFRLSKNLELSATGSYHLNSMTDKSRFNFGGQLSLFF